MRRENNQRAWGTLNSGVVASLAALALGLTVPCPASADSITTWTVNAAVSTSAGGIPPSYAPIGGTESYGSNYTIEYSDGGILPMGTNQAIDSGGVGSTYTTVPTQPSLTSVNLGITSTNSYNSNVANANAYANLATGSVGVSSINTVLGYGDVDSAAVAALADTLTFNIPGATSSTITDIGVIWSISGGVTSGTDGKASMQGFLDFGNSNMSTGWVSDDVMLSNNFPTGVLGWASSDVVSNTSNSVIIDAEYALTGPDPTIPVELFLECVSGQDGSCDYYDTESINLTLPEGVTYTSASGAFLTQSLGATPEPGSFLLFGTALLGLGWTVRRWSLRSSYRTGGPLIP